MTPLLNDPVKPRYAQRRRRVWKIAWAEAKRRPRNPRKNSGQALKARRNVVPGPVRSIQQVRLLSGRAFSARSPLKTIPGPARRFSPGFKSGRAVGAEEPIPQLA